MRCISRAWNAGHMILNLPISHNKLTASDMATLLRSIHTEMSKSKMMTEPRISAVTASALSSARQIWHASANFEK